MDQERLGFVLGLSVFLIGIILLLATFYLAYSVFTNPNSITVFSALAPEVEGEMKPLIGPVVDMMPYSLVALMLWVMGSVSGRVAKRGLELFNSRSEVED